MYLFFKNFFIGLVSVVSLFFLTGLLFVGGVFGQEDNQDAFVARYEFAQILQNAVCQECLNPDMIFQERYGEEWYDNAKKDARIAIDDITVGEAMYNGENYYYCVSSTVDKGLMQGFPRDTSPYCAGKFCGSSVVTYSELVTALDRLYCSENNCSSITLANSEDPVARQEERLLEGGILMQEEMDRFARYQPVPQRFIMQKIDEITEIVGCDARDDTDNDGVADAWDVCPDRYDVYQYDRDRDNIGDICDDDIDNDGIKNVLGVVDPLGNLIRSRVEESEDNCILDKNEEQINTDSDLLGDSCDKAPDVAGLEITALPRVGAYPLSVSFEALGGPFTQVEWYLGDNYKKRGEQVEHRYDESGKKTVTAIGTLEDGRQLQAATQVVVTTPPEASIGYQIAGDLALSGNELTVNFVEDHTGEISQTRWEKVDQADDEVEVSEYASNETAPINFEETGLYFVESQAYSSLGERVGLSQVSLLIEDFTLPIRYSAIYTENLTPQRGESFVVTTVLENILPEEVDNVEWGWGDEMREETDQLRNEFVFEQPGTYIIRQRLVFEDRDYKAHNNILTVKVVEEDLAPTAQLSADPQSTTPGETINFSLDTIGVTQEQLETVVWDFGDTTTRRVDTLQDQENTYLQAGEKNVTAEIMLVSGEEIFTSTSVVVEGGAVCLGESIDMFECDMDDDGIPDLCDEDVDGDGIENWLGLIREEPENCEYGYNIKEIDQQVFDEYRQAILDEAPYDNCFLDENEEQEDDNNNAWGNVCEPGGADAGGDDGGDDQGGDSAGGSPGGPSPGGDDGGGASAGPGDSDCGGGGCELPSNDDGDGSDDGGDPSVEPEECNQCPCPEADYSSEIWKGDQIRALLLDEAGDVIYRYSVPEVIDQDIPDNMLGG